MMHILACGVLAATLFCHETSRFTAHISLHAAVQPVLSAFQAASLLAMAGRQACLTLCQSYSSNGSGPISAGVHYLINCSAHLIKGLMQGGAVVYALRIPERWRPGAFDIYFHSHQLFHIAVIIAAAVHYKVNFASVSHARF